MSDDVVERFDLEESAEELGITVERINGLAQALEQAESADPETIDDEPLADIVHALKRVESAAEDARKDVFEDELDGRVDEGETIGQLSKQTGSSTWVSDAEGAFAAVAEEGHDPMDVADVSIGDLRDVLGVRADEYIGESSYSYFRRQA